MDDNSGLVASTLFIEHYPLKKIKQGEVGI